MIRLIRINLIKKFHQIATINKKHMMWLLIKSKRLINLNRLKL